MAGWSITITTEPEAVHSSPDCDGVLAFWRSDA